MPYVWEGGERIELTDEEAAQYPGAPEGGDDEPRCGRCYDDGMEPDDDAPYGERRCTSCGGASWAGA